MKYFFKPISLLTFHVFFFLLSAQIIGQDINTIKSKIHLVGKANVITQSQEETSEIFRRAGFNPWYIIGPVIAVGVGTALVVTSGGDDNTSSSIIKINCPANQTVNNDQEKCDKMVPGLVATASGGTGITIGNSFTSEGPNASGVYSVGTTSVSFTAADDSGTTASCKTTITVLDTEDPFIECKDITRNLDDGPVSVRLRELYMNETDNCGIPAVTMDGTDPIRYEVAGTDQIILMATDNSGNTYSCTATVTIEETQGLTITCPADQTVNTSGDCGVEVVLSPATAGGGSGAVQITNDFNNQGQDASGFFEVGSTTITYSVTDDSGDMTSCQTTITVVDSDPPTISCPESQNLDTDSGQCFTTYDYSDLVQGNDNCEGEVITQADGLPSGSQFPVGTTTNTFNITDATGNTNTCSFNVTVTDGEKPKTKCQNIEVSLDTSGSAIIMAEAINNGSTDNCGVQKISVSPTSFNCSNVGNNTVTMTVTDENGNVASCTSIVNITDNIAPEPLCKNHTVELDTNGTAHITPEDADAGSTDNCTNVSLALSKESFDCNDIPNTSVTLTVTDDYSNSATCVATISVEDNADPSAICTDITVQLNESGQATITADDIDGGSTDNCSIDKKQISRSVFFTEDVRDNNVILTVSDLTGNQGTCTAIVSVVEKSCTPFDYVATVSRSNIVCQTPGLLVFSVESPTPEDVLVEFTAPGGSFTESLSPGVYQIDMPWVGTYTLHGSLPENNSYCDQSYDEIVVDESYVIEAVMDTFDNYLVGDIVFSTTGPYSWYLDDMLAGTSEITHFDYLTPLNPGTHSAYVIDINGCSSDIFTFDIPSLTGEIASALLPPKKAFYLSIDNPIYPLPDESSLLSFTDNIDHWKDVGILDNPDAMNVIPQRNFPNLQFELQLHPRIIIQSQFSMRGARANYQFDIDDNDPLHLSNLIKGLAGIEAIRFYLNDNHNFFLSPGMGWDVWNIDPAYTMVDGITHQYQSKKQLKNLWGYFSSGFRFPLSQFTNIEVSTAVISRKDGKGNLSSLPYGLVHLLSKF